MRYVIPAYHPKWMFRGANDYYGVYTPDFRFSVILGRIPGRISNRISKILGRISWILRIQSIPTVMGPISRNSGLVSGNFNDFKSVSWIMGQILRISRRN